MYAVRHDAGKLEYSVGANLSSDCRSGAGPNGIVWVIPSDKPHDLPLKTIPMSDVLLLYLLEIF
jgi:hypothetical protein